MTDDEQHREHDEDQRLRLIGRLAGSVAHDLNNLFTAAYAALDGLARPELVRLRAGEIGVGPGHDELRRQLRQCVDRGAALARWMVAFGRVRGGPPDVVDPGLLLQAGERTLRGCLPPGVEFELRLRRDAGLLLADEGLVEQLLLTLLWAGCREATTGGLVSVHCQPAAGGALSLGVSLDGRAPPAAPGLAALVARLGGSLADDRPDDLAVLLPTVDEGDERDGVYAERVSLATTAGDAASGPAHVLLCEGDQLLRESLGAQLEIAGHVVFGAAGAAEAQARCVAAGALPSLLICDLDGVHGDDFGVLRSLCERRPDLPVLYLCSMSSALGDELPRPEPPGVLTLCKPFRNSDLMDHVRRLIG